MRTAPWRRPPGLPPGRDPAGLRSPVQGGSSHTPRATRGNRDQPARSGAVMMELVRIAAIDGALPPDRAIARVACRGNEDPGGAAGNLQEFGVRAANADGSNGLVALGNLQLVLLRDHAVNGTAQFAAVESGKQRGGKPAALQNHGNPVGQTEATHGQQCFAGLGAEGGGGARMAPLLCGTRAGLPPPCRKAPCLPWDGSPGSGPPPGAP